MKRSINRIIKESVRKTLINELGGMEDVHPRFGKLNLKKLSMDDLESLYNNDDDDFSVADDFMTIDGQTGEYGPFDRDGDEIPSSIDLDDDGDGILDEDYEYDEEFEMPGAAHRSSFRPTPREKEMMGVFGDMYGEDIPPVVIRYMRKNPEKIIKRLYAVYGDKMFDYIGRGGLDEAETENVERTKYSKSEVDQARQKNVGFDVEDGTVTPNEDGGITVTRKR
jgi:hypothetical protein